MRFMFLLFVLQVFFIMFANGFPKKICVMHENESVDKENPLQDKEGGFGIDTIIKVPCQAGYRLVNGECRKVYTNF